ncbi:MAG: replicative DNA helicase [Halarsenatibacteraceae bacterium]
MKIYDNSLEDFKDIEKSMIMVCLSDYKNEYETLSDLMIEIKPEYFTDPTCRKIFNWLGEFYDSGRPISRTRLLQEVGLPDDFLDTRYLYPTELQGLIAKVKDNFQRRQIKAAAGELQSLTDHNLSAEEYRSRAIETIFKYTDNHQGNSNLKTFADAIKLSLDNLRLKDSESDQGIMTGFLSLDHTFGRFEPGHLTVLAGQTSMGKTAFALNLAYNCIASGHKTLYVSLEMTAKELADRLLITHSEVKASDYQQEISDDQLEKIMASATEIGDHPLYISDKRGLRVSDIRAQAIRAKNRYGLDLLVVDYLQFIHHIDTENKANAIAHSVSTLRELAGELEIPVILLSQLNRTVDGKPAPKHLRGSGSIEEVADEVVLLWRRDYKRETESQRMSSVQEAELIIAKGRTKGVGFVPLYWYPEIQLFKDKLEVDLAEKQKAKLA